MFLVASFYNMIFISSEDSTQRAVTIKLLMDEPLDYQLYI